MNKTQTCILEASFSVNRYPNRTTLKQLALQTGRREESVYHWFSRKRRKIGSEEIDGKPYTCESA